MKFQSLRKKLIILGAIYVVFGTCYTTLYFYLNKNHAELDRRKFSLKGQIMSTNTQMANLERKAREVNEAMKLWKRLTGKQKKREGLRIDEVQKRFKKMRVDYKVSDMHINFSTPKELKNKNYKTATTVVVSSDVNLKYSSLSDEYILSLAGAIIKDFTGYVKVKSFRMKKESDLDKKTLLRISRGEKPSIVTGELQFKWRDLKDISQEKKE